MKYIRFENALVLFTDSMSHNNMAFNLNGIAGKPISAGKVSLSEGKAICWGESITLQIKSHPDDTRILQIQLGNDA